MNANSRPVSSVQDGPHRRLAELVARHVRHAYRRPVADYSRRAFDEALARWDGRAPLALDAGCGTGASTIALAHAHPGHFVIGVDRSAHRLARGKPQPAPANAHLARADLEDFWLLLGEAGLRLDRHWLLYPNPWPKIGQVGRRWPAHAVFPQALALGGRIECRSNWKVYVEEFAAAAQQLTGRQAHAAPFVPAAPLTPFERKYLASGHALYRCVLEPA